jgi:hypothetical protein
MLIEGSRAELAVGELLARALIEVQVEQLASARGQQGKVAVSVRILSLAGGGAETIADKLRSWSKKWREACRGEAPFEVLIKAGGTQRRMDGVSTRELAALLQQLPARSQA